MDAGGGDGGKLGQLLFGAVVVVSWQLIFFFAFSSKVFLLH